MIATVALRNVGPFRGDHVVHLGPRVYALVARWESDPGRSNWSGKSFFLEMIRFALTGDLPKWRRSDADGWITRGEKSGAVSVALEGGYAAKRERDRGHATQVTWSTPHGSPSRQDAAEAAILRHLALATDDFPRAAYFEQGMMSNFVRTKPEKRFDVVRGWLGLDKAEAAEDRVAATARDAAKDLAHIRVRRAAIVGMLESDVVADVVTIRALRDELAGQIAAAEAAARDAAGADQARAAVAAFDDVKDTGVRLAAELAVMLAANPNLDARAARADEDYREASARALALSRDADARKKVALGLFDGRCPVAGIDCPARDRINGDREASGAELRLAECQLEIARKDEADAHRAVTVLTGRMNDARARRAEIDRLRQRARDLLPDARAGRRALREVPAPRGAGLDLDGARRVHAEAVAACARAEAAEAHRVRLQAELQQLDDALDRARRDVDVLVASRAVMRAASRRIAERSLDRISSRASDTLRGAGVDLSVSMRWEYEGKELSRTCDVCGAAFPSGEKAKHCDQCGSDRPRAVVQRLEPVLSDRSGAADDLAGVAMQVAAAEWLLRRRGSPWATAILDEPMAACDRTNRRALGGQLARLLTGGVFRQALIVSHSPDTVDLYPGRITIVVAEDGARRIEVTP